MFERKVEHMLMARIAQESPPLYTSAEVFGNKGHRVRIGSVLYLIPYSIVHTAMA